MGESRLRLPLVLFIGLVCGWLNVVGRFFGEEKWRADQTHASCAATDGLFSFEVRLVRHGQAVQGRSVAECEGVRREWYATEDQLTWAHLQAFDELGVQDKPWGHATVERRAEKVRTEQGSAAQRAWHGLFRLTSFLSLGSVGAEHAMVWDRIATATLSCLLAMLLVGLALRRFAPARDPVVAV
jgi:hypothetical protein